MYITSVFIKRRLKNATLHFVNKASRRLEKAESASKFYLYHPEEVTVVI